MSAPTRDGPDHPPDTSSLDDFFVAGGTLRPGAASYVTRPTDDELFHLALAGEFCFVLTPRQMGKSSLMVRTAQRLKEHGVHSAIIDLTQIGTGIEVEQWYLGLLSQLRRRLRLATDPAAWWQARQALGDVQRFTDFLRDVVLTETEGRVVIFIDEIDTTLKLDFRDDFFAAVRAVYNARADEPEFERLTFILLGVASPTELIKDPARTPFNIGHAITLQEFNREDAAVLRDGLEAVCPGQGQAIMDGIYHWTSGHPYLTQKLCLAIAESPRARWTEPRIDALVTKLFLADEARRETNLQFVQDKILSHDRHREMLALYRKVLRGNTVRDDGQSQVHNHLKLSGLVKSTGNTLAVRNEIYRRAFDLGWVREHTAVNPYPIIVGVLAALILAITGVLAHDVWAGIRFDDCFTSFYQNEDPNQRLDDLACAFKVRTLVLRGNYVYQAQDMFYGLSREEQLALIGARGTRPSDKLVVVNGLYVTLADVDETDSTGPLLAEMARGLYIPDGGDEPAGLLREIEAWQRGRATAREGRVRSQDGQVEAAAEAYNEALDYYNQAIDEAAAGGRENPATLYERARVLTALGRYADALDDLDGVAAIASRGPQPTNTPEPTEPPTPTPLRTATPSTTPALAATGMPRGTAATGEVASPLPLTKAPFTSTLGIATAATRELTATTTRTPTPEPTREPAEIQARFATVSQIVNAVRALINGSPGLLDALAQAPADSYPNLRAAGLVPTTRELPPTGTVPAVTAVTASVTAARPTPTTLTPTATEPGTSESRYRVTWLSVAAPATGNPGEVVTFAVRMRNDGTRTWVPTGQQPFYLSYRWLDADRNVVVNDGLVTELGREVVPGQEVTVQAKVQFPDMAGRYILQIDMVHEFVTWFEWQGSTPHESWVDVGQTLTPTITPTLTVLPSGSSGTAEPGVPAPATYARIGVVGRNSEFFEEADYQLIRVAGLETVKLLSSTDPAVFERIKRENPDIEIIVTLYDDRFRRDSRVSPGAFVTKTVPIINSLQPYATKFEILYEPNHASGIGGWGASDEDARSFNSWYLEALPLLREACPWASFGFPGLAINSRDLEWLDICRGAVEASDWLGSHDYWQYSNMLNDQWGLRFKLYHEMFPDKPIEITEFGDSTPDLPRDQVAERYVEYYQELANYPYVRSASAFIMSTVDPAWYLFVWRTEDGKFLPVVDMVANMERPPR